MISFMVRKDYEGKFKTKIYILAINKLTLISNI